MRTVRIRRGAIAAAALAWISTVAAAQNPSTANPSTMPRLGTVDPRFASYNVEMVEITGGRFWKPYDSASGSAPAQAGSTGAPAGLDPGLFEQRIPINLANPRLRKLAAALGPAYMRVSGTWQNSTFFQDDDRPAGPVPPGFNSVLTRAEWKGVVDFARAVNARIVTSFATSMGTRDRAGLWTPVEAKKFLRYNDSLGSPIAAAEFMNEPTFVTVAGVPPGYNAQSYGKDFIQFQKYFRQAEPHTLILGPGSVGEGIDIVPGTLLPSKDLLAASGLDPVDAFSYHFYGGVSERCASFGSGRTTPQAALSAGWLDLSARVEAFYAKLRDEYAPGKPMWLTETGQTACGGDRWASTFLDTFRYLNQMGVLAQRGVQVILHNTLAASDYALIDEKTVTPRPNYWATLLWDRTMGTTVLDPGTPAPGQPERKQRIFAQCMKGQPGGVTLLLLNLSPDQPGQFTLTHAATRYTLTAPQLTSHSVLLNGTDLQLSAAGDLPALRGVAAPRGSVTLPPASITFFTLPDAANPACR